MNQKTKKALNIVSYVLIGLIFLMAAMVLMISLTSQKVGELPQLFGASVMTVKTDSMKRTYKGDSEDGISNNITFGKGDLIFVKRLNTLDAKSDLKVGDVIVFVDWSIGGPGEWEFNAHKIVKVPEGTVNGAKVYVTRGVGLDSEGKQIPQNASGNDTHYYDSSDPEFHSTLSAASVIGVYTGKLPGMGAVFAFFKSFVGFGLLIVLPLFAFLAYRIYIVVKLAIAVNKEKKEGTTLSEMEKMQAEIEKLKAELKGDKAENKGADKGPVN